MAPVPVETPKRNGGAPQHLAKLDLAAERQKSAKLNMAKSSPDKNPVQEEKKNQSQDQSNNHSLNNARAGAKKVAPNGKNGKVAIASDDQFNDIGDAATAEANKQSTGTTGKARPASASSKQVKSVIPVRPASAGPTSKVHKRGRGSGDDNPQATDGQNKPAVARASADAIVDFDEENETTGRSVDEKEPEAKGLYGIFVQTRRCETLCYEAGLKLKHIRTMKSKFDDNDMYHTGEITQAEFFFILTEDRRPLTKGILQYGDVAHDQKFMDFDEFLLCVVSFAVLTPPEVYQFVFDLYDADQSGTLDEYEFAKMGKEMQSKQFSFPKNTELAIKLIEGKDSSGKRGSGGAAHAAAADGLVNLADFMKFAKLYPMAFYPLFNFQRNVRRVTLGQSKWSSLAARKLKIQELVSHMRRHNGEIPELSLGEWLWGIVDDEVHAVRKRAAELYCIELDQRRLVGDAQ